MLDKVISFTLYICAGIKYYFNAETKANNSPDTFVRKEKEEPLTLAFDAISKTEPRGETGSDTDIL